MKKQFTALMGIFCLSLFLVSSVQAQVSKIATVDLSKVFDNYEKTKEYDEFLAGKTTAYEKERDAKLEKIREVQGKLALLKEEEKEAKQKEFEKMRADFLEFEQAQRADLGKERDEKVREILLEIESVVKEFAEKNKFDIILNDRVLIYGKETLDVSDQVLKILNENYNKK